MSSYVHVQVGCKKFSRAHHQPPASEAAALDLCARQPAPPAIHLPLLDLWARGHLPLAVLPHPCGFVESASSSVSSMLLLRLDKNQGSRQLVKLGSAVLHA